MPDSRYPLREIVATLDRNTSGRLSVLDCGHHAANDRTKRQNSRCKACFLHTPPVNLVDSLRSALEAVEFDPQAFIRIRRHFLEALLVKLA
jgi:hypothetical protein